MGRWHWLAAFAVSGVAIAGCSSTPTTDSDSTTTNHLVASGNCTYTIGYWKTHPEAWPVSSLTLGTVSYTKTQLLAIFNQPVKGNGLISLAHQLIGAKLNVAAGADPSAASGAIAAADALIGGLVVPPVGSGSLAPGATSSLTSALDSYNTGATGPGHCGDTPPPPPPPVCRDGTVDSGETCDDGNTVNGDGCSSTCQIEPPPPPSKCGNGIVEPGEACDDGNLDNWDGCSEICQIQWPCTCH